MTLLSCETLHFKVLKKQKSKQFAYRYEIRHIFKQNGKQEYTNKLNLPLLKRLCLIALLVSFYLFNRKKKKQKKNKKH